MTIGQRSDVNEALAQSRTVALIAGRSCGGKSTLLAGLMERLCAAGYQFCALDPEGDCARHRSRCRPAGERQSRGDHAPNSTSVYATRESCSAERTCT
ncbi:protein of unknown function (plasmid) [Caballeronia sp. S22]